MKVLQLNTFDKGGGAAKAAYRLHRGLIDQGIDSHFLTREKTQEDPTVIEASSPGGLLSSFGPYIDALPRLLYPRRKRKALFSSAIVGIGIARDLRSLTPDVIHLHWVTDGFLRPESLSAMNRPLLWTLHDSWPFTGGCHLPFDCDGYRYSCGRCPLLGGEKAEDFSQRLLKRKRKAWQELPLTLIAPSRWLAGCARSSSLFKDHPVEFIPNGIDTEFFKPFDPQECRRFWNLPQERKLILFGARNPTGNSNKGFSLLLQAIQDLPSSLKEPPPLLVIFGDSSPPSSSPFPIHSLGKIEDESALAKAYGAADLFASPSLHENLSNTVMEALSCGTPAVAFDVGGMADLIDHKKNGYLAAPFKTESLTHGIRWILNHGNRPSLSWEARTKVQSQFSLPSVCRRHIDLYRSLL